MRGLSLLVAMAAWLYAPDVALIYGHDPASATYQANGLFGAWLALYALSAKGPPPLFDGAALLLAFVLWSLQFVCDLFYTSSGPSAAICDDVTNRPINLICAAAVLFVCSLADRHRGRDA